MTDLPNIDELALLPIVEKAFDAIALAGPRPWRLVYANPVLANRLGVPASELRGRPLEDLFGDASRGALIDEAERAWRGETPQTAVVGELRVDETRPGRTAIRFCRIDVDGAPLLGVIVHSGGSPQHVDLPHAPRHDPLTGLPDRDFLLARLTALLQGERSADQRFAVLFVDLDNFKQVNDAHGHLVGDRVLREVAQRLSGCVREGDRVVRFGGDEFVVLLEQVAGRREIEPVIGRIHAALARPIALPEGDFTLSLSIGVAEASPEHRSPDDLLRAADRAMYAAKTRS